MKKIKKENYLSLINGGTNWMECTYLTAGAMVTTIYVPLAGWFLAGYSAACWSKLQ
jgi:hypothetical protein